MSLQEQINQDYIDAMKTKDKKQPVISMMRAAIKQVEVDTRKELNDEDVIKILKSEAKKIKDSIEAFRKGDRNDLVAKESYELQIIEAYLPAQMDKTIIKEIVTKIVADTQKGSQDMGKVMGAVMAEIKKQGDADGNIVQKIVKDELNK